MKIEVSKDLPHYFQPAFPGEFDMFSHLETATAIPHALFAITTWKENGQPNVCLHSWSCFHGDRTAFFAVMGGLYQHTHTYANIRREKCFAINFLPFHLLDRLTKTIEQNGPEEDEFAAGGFALESAASIHAPVIGESFLTIECTLKDIQDLSGAGITAMVIGQVERVAVEEAFAQGYARHGKDGFVLYVPAPQNLRTGESSQSGFALLDLQKTHQD